ncbi:ribokinase [Furfurilactobacillus siliginis]|nr:ribokinase [Furfurilactobacillus siliginis]GEK27900.1 ribokinase [Furfurilactobacillus siliginis]
MANKVVVLGSLNVDSILRIPRLPLPGETMEMNDKSSAPGGKGANQAVAAARAGAQTAFIGKVGADDGASVLREALESDGISTEFVTTDEQRGSGQAYILLQESGQNSILVYAGSNQSLSKEDVDAAKDIIKDADFLISQFETPIETTTYAFEYAQSVGVTTILNPAPAVPTMPADLLKVTDLICPNETEAATITGIEVTDAASMLLNAAKFAQMGCKELIITVGSRGAFYANQDGSGFVDAFKVKAVDTTAAGDTFLGALSSQLKTDFSNMRDAIVFANHASSLTVQRLGAQPSIPMLEEIKAEYNK